MRTISRLILSAVFLLLTGLCVAAAVYAPELFFAFYTDFSKKILSFLSGVTGPFPFPVWEVVLVLIVLLAIYFLIRCFTQKRSVLCWLAGVAELVCILVFLFVGLWGLNHYGPSVADRVGLTVTEYSRDQLKAATQYMADQASLWSDRVDRDANGDLAIDFSAMAKTAGKAYEPLAKTNDFFDGSTAPVKRLLAGKVFSYMGTTGIFIAFSGESCVNPDTYAASVPFTMCHEAAHRLTVAPEDEANFCAFLACQASDDPAFQYSGWYSAFVYCYNALYKVDKNAAAEVWSTLSAQVVQDCRRANDHYDQYEGQVQDAAQKLNDTYLKAFSEESGVQSYGEVADLLIAWYLVNG
ncbi:MAG: DUF3810 domain-containing protein [Candidatus Avoscillospira sp.]